MISNLKLPFTYSEKRLLADLVICEKEEFVVHFNVSNYEGTWESIALQSIGAEAQNIFANPNEERPYEKTPLLNKCTYFNEIIDFFECEKESIRLLRLKTNSKIKEHKDHNLGYEDGCFRIHIPIKTNPDVNFVINDERVLMNVGECWYGNFNLPHWVSNDGENDRVHLVMDCIRNEWSDKLFLKVGYNFEDENLETVYSDETKLQMINELKRIDTPVARQLIEQLKSELA